MTEPKTPTDPPVHHDRDTVGHAEADAGAPGGTDGDPHGSGAPGALVGAYFDRKRGADLGTTIVQVVAEAEGAPPESLDGPPLHDRIDAEHLEKAMFGPGTNASRETRVGFSYRGHRVHVRGDGYVYVADGAGR
jgi:hypothetical protein